AAGATLALPFLESLMSSRALAGGEVPRPPLRMGIVTWGAGTVIESWKPKEAGPLTQLPRILRPLEFVKEQLLIVSGLSNTGRGEGDLNGHTHCAWTHLTGAELVKAEGSRVRASISVDQAAARVVGRETVLPSLELGLGSNRYSFRTPDTLLPSEEDPRLVFERMFRGRKKVVPNWSRRPTHLSGEVDQAQNGSSDEQSVIDAVLGQARDVRAKLGKDDRCRLDGYLESVRSVERRIRLTEIIRREEEIDEKNPGPSELALPKGIPADQAEFTKLRRLIEQDPDYHAQYLRLMSDLMVLAFQTDTTRVCALSSPDDALWPGVVTVGYERHYHVMQHGGNGNPADPIAREALRQIHTWQTQLFAEMVRKMKAIDEGGSTLLDNCMLLYTSYMANGGHSREDCPMLLVGRAQGTLKTGQHLAFPMHTPVANLYVEMLDRMGVKVDSFGDSRSSKHAAFDGRLPGLA
ncbi:MAG TPA: DUF1552 domain-containing protein, partial [Planctomycetota bacterium]|nr:DUF1552 domain-containing protein [Planctomycetota bacterium]